MMSFVFAGVLGIKVKIMLPHDLQGKSGPKKPLPDSVSELALGYQLYNAFIKPSLQRTGECA